jgi:hypothetical protein
MVYVPSPPESFRDQFVLRYPQPVIQRLSFRVSATQIHPKTLQLTPTVSAADHTLRTQSAFAKRLIQESALVASAQIPSSFQVPVSTDPAPRPSTPEY